MLSSTADRSIMPVAAYTDALPDAKPDMQVEAEEGYGQEVRARSIAQPGQPSWEDTQAHVGATSCIKPRAGMAC